MSCWTETWGWIWRWRLWLQAWVRKEVNNRALPTLTWSPRTHKLVLVSIGNMTASHLLLTGLFWQEHISIFIYLVFSKLLSVYQHGWGSPFFSAGDILCPLHCSCGVLTEWSTASNCSSHYLLILGFSLPPILKVPLILWAPFTFNIRGIHSLLGVSQISISVEG